MGRLKTDTWERMLEQMEQEGVGFYLNGKKTAPREIIRTCCMREKAVYMPDFVMDEEGKLSAGQKAGLWIYTGISTVRGYSLILQCTPQKKDILTKRLKHLADTFTGCRGFRSITGSRIGQRGAAF